MAILNKIIITCLLLISIAFFHCSAFHDIHLEAEEFKPPHQQGPGGGSGGGSGGGWEANNPYHYEGWRFEEWFKSKEGFVKMLQKFTRRSSSIFRGIENYRFMFMEMEPNTFFVPLHVDADIVFIALQGNGVVSFVTDKTKESFEIVKGDVVRVPSGVTHFFTNTNDTVPFRAAKIVIPVNIPGRFQVAFPARSRFQQSYFSGFSRELLSASFNLPEELIEKLTKGSQQQRGQREAGVIKKASPDQIKELAQHATSPSHKHKDKCKHSKEEEEEDTSDFSTLWRPFNIFEHDPLYANDFGHFHEAHPKRFSQLQDLGVSVAWANITQGSLFLPQYNSKTTFVTFVENGCARFEMASPYTSKEEQQQPWFPQLDQQEEEEEEEQVREMTGQVHKIVSRVCKGEVFVIPAGHPFAILSQDEHFVAVGFGINALNCTRTFLAGKENLLNNLDTVATRLAFGVESKVAEKMFTSQNYSHFAPTVRRSSQHSPEQRKPTFQSIFDFAGF
ncbi:unnamed protein product [Cochlearia groenlandica]